MRKTVLDPAIRTHVICASIGALMLLFSLVFLIGVAVFDLLWPHL